MLLKLVGIDMYVLKFDTLQAAQDRSRAEAAKYIENATTELWWGVVKCDSEYWLVVSDGTPDAVEVADDSPLELIPDPLDAQAAQAALTQQAKAARLDAVARIKVTTASGKVFDGDEVSQTRMARAVVALQAAGLPETTWVLADNTPATVTLAELAEALALAGAEQTRLWVS